MRLAILCSIVLSQVRMHTWLLTPPPLPGGRTSWLGFDIALTVHFDPLWQVGFVAAYTVFIVSGYESPSSGANGTTDPDRGEQTP